MHRIDARAAAEIVLDGRSPSGDDLHEDDISDALRFIYERDPDFARLLYVARYGQSPEGVPLAWEERLEAFNEVERRATLRAEAPVDAAYFERLYEDAVTGDRDARRRANGSPLRIRMDGEKRVSRPNAAETRSMLEEEAQRQGQDPATLLRPARRGRPSASESARIDCLARVVSAARERGARGRLIAAVIGCSKQTVSQLEERGRALIASANE